jgi:hypothetical protein
VHNASGNAKMREKHQRLEMHSALALKELRLFLIFLHQRLELCRTHGEALEVGPSRPARREERRACSIVCTFSYFGFRSTVARWQADNSCTQVQNWSRGISSRRKRMKHALDAAIRRGTGFLNGPADRAGATCDPTARRQRKHVLQILSK